MSISIKNFKVLNTTTGQMQINGRLNSDQLTIIKSINKIITGTTNAVSVPGTPSSITSGALYQNAHMSTTYIKIVRTPYINTTIDTIYIPDGILRISYLEAINDFRNTILYGFTSNINENITNIVFNVAFANNLSQTNGDFIDISLPNMYNELYIVIILLANAWDKRIIVNSQTCSILSTDAKYNYCINPNQSITDVNQSHFIVIQGVNLTQNIFSHIVLGIEDDKFLYSDKDYDDVQLAIGSRSIFDGKINDTFLK